MRNIRNGVCRFKKQFLRSGRNIKSLEDDFYKILRAEPKTYTRPGESPDRWEIGYIAEEFDELGLNNLVYYREKSIGEDGKVIDTWDDEFVVGDPEGVNYRKISLYLVEIVKDQQQKLEELEARIEQLEDN